MSTVHLFETLRNCRNPANLEPAFALSHYCMSGRYPSGYRAAEEWENSVALSEYGKLIVNNASTSLPEVPRQDILMAAFGFFCHAELLIDLQATDIETIFCVVNREIRDGIIRLPYRFGRLLYDLFNARYPDTDQDRLTADETIHFLSQSPQGVYQYGCMLAGPFGLLSSAERRFIPMSLQPLVLYHVRKEGEVVPGRVTFYPPQIAIVDAFGAISKAAFSGAEKSRPWREAFAINLMTPRSDIAWNYENLAFALAECVIGQELSSLLAEAIRTEEGSAIREHIDSAEQYAGKKKDYSDLSMSMNDAERLQLLLTLPDRALVRILDKCCREGMLAIPEGEIRAARQGIHGHKSRRWGNTEISKRGARCKHGDALSTLSALIEEAYSSHNLHDDLKWSMGLSGGGVSRKDIVDYIQRSGPSVAVQSLVATRKPIAEYFLETLGIDYFPSSQVELGDLLLWKVGFGSLTYDEQIERVITRLERFREILLYSPDTKREEDRERIRSVGVNLFVSLEGFLQTFISYITWLLATDHYMEEFRSYNESRAMLYVSSFFGESLEGGGSGVVHRWDSRGKNAFACILRYLSELTLWVKCLSNADRSSILREEGGFPPPHITRFRPFAFRHLQLWADRDPNGLQQFQQEFGEISRLIMQADIANIRNGIDHNRTKEDFPTIDRMLALHGRIEGAIQSIDMHRMVPKRYWLHEERVDNNGNKTYLLRDYRDKEILLKGPANAWGLKRHLKFGEPLVIAPRAIYVGAYGELVFKVAQESIFTRYWDGYPIVRGDKDPAPHAVCVTPGENAAVFN